MILSDYALADMIFCGATTANRQLPVAKPDRRGMVGAMSTKTSDTPDQSGSSEAPHYHGHRMRLRERFQSAGPDALSDYELLEMVLFTAQPRGDMKPLAKSLLKTFGSFAEVIHAPATRLREIKGIGDRTITEFKLIAAAAHRIARGQLRQRTLLSSWNDVIAYCRTSMVLWVDNIVFTDSGTNPRKFGQHPKREPPKYLRLGDLVVLIWARLQDE
jgi:hypothetical protein